MNTGENFRIADHSVKQRTEPVFNAPELLLAQAPGQDQTFKMQTASLVDAGFLPSLQLEPAVTNIATDATIKISEKTAAFVGDLCNQTRALESINNIPDTEWSKAYTQFPELTSRLSRTQATRLMKALVLNELEHADPRDWTQETLSHAVVVPDVWTLGFTQLSTKAVRERSQEFPEQLSRYKGHERAALIDPAQAPYLVAATLAHYVKQFQKYNYPINESTLGYAYNPDLRKPDGMKNIMPGDSELSRSSHARNVRRWIDFLNE